MRGRPARSGELARRLTGLLGNRKESGDITEESIGYHPLLSVYHRLEKMADTMGGLLGQTKHDGPHPNFYILTFFGARHVILHWVSACSYGVLTTYGGTITMGLLAGAAPLGSSGLQRVARPIPLGQVFRTCVRS